MMKKLITLSAMAWFFLALTAQEVKLTIETTAGHLKDSIPAEQRQTVTDLTLTGNMNDADFYLIRDEMPKLKTLNMEHIEVDTIPEKAFYGHKSLRDVTLPAYVKYLGDQSFKNGYPLDIWISGIFPGLGEDVFGGNARMDVLPENKFCKKNIECIYGPDGKTVRWECESILSFDGKIFYYGLYYGNLFYIPDGVETIESKSFDGAGIGTVVFRPSVRLIKKSAFTNILPMWAHSETELCLEFNTAIPPTLEENAFDDDQFSDFFLLVPEGSIDKYRNSDPQWSVFKYILEEGEEDPGSITPNTSTRSLTVVKNETHWIIKGESMIKSIEVFTPSGRLLDSILCDNTEACLPAIHFQSIQILKIRYENGQVEVIKLTN